jgi:hypothetical protein
MRRKRERKWKLNLQEKKSRTSDFNGLYPNIIQSIFLCLAVWFILEFPSQQRPNRYTSQSKDTLKDETRNAPTT